MAGSSQMTFTTQRACGWVTQALVALVLASYCGGVVATPSGDSGVLADVLRAVLLDARHPYLATLDVVRYRGDLEQLYEARDYAPLWSHAGIPTRQSIDVIAALRAAENVGLRSADYEGNSLVYLLIDLSTSRSAGEEQWALFDIALTTAVAGYARDVHFGRIDPRAAGFDIEVEHARLDLPPLIEGLSHSSDVAGVLRDLEPPFTHYELLKQALAHYRELSFDPRLTQLPPLPARSVRPGEAYVGAPQLRVLLREVGDMPREQTPHGTLPTEIEHSTLLDRELVEGLKRFQSRHGLDVDGALGRKTFAALTMPMTRRVAQIEATLERWRWLPPRLDSPPIIVNIPQFRLFAFRTVQDREDSMLTMEVIVGKAYPANRTPVFIADMKYIVLRPYWDVPYALMIKELLPSILSDPDYLAAQRLEIVSGRGEDAVPVPPTAENLAALAEGSLHLRQQPGPDNALGLVKFMMPNIYSVYLHDTPAQALFARSRRSFSHGCVRVADPIALAQYALREDPTWTRERILEGMNGEGPLQINLLSPIRVFVIYGTAVATESGRVLFFEDIYGHDAQLERLLHASRLPHRVS
jgi:murein L,D-transpeptidase YcbB/YkuD